MPAMQFQWFLILLYLGIIAAGGYMLWRALRIARGDARLLSDWMGNPLPHAGRFRPIMLALNLVAGAALLGVAVATPVAGLPFAWWSGLAAIVFWTFFLAQHLVAWKARQAEIEAQKSRSGAKR